MQDQFERVIPLTAIHNFRDYGGYAVGGGGRMAKGKLFRSAQHFGATDADLQRLSLLQLGTVVDLRGEKERAWAPSPRPANFCAAVIETELETASRAPHVEASESGNSARAAHERMIKVYQDIAFRDELNGLLRRYFAALASSDQPALIHCLAGKDRTGLAVALLHDLLGVHADDIMADYMLTNTAGDAEARIAAGARSLSKQGGGVDEGALRVIMSVHPTYLDTAFATIRARHGSVIGYMRDVLQVDDARRNAITARLLV